MKNRQSVIDYAVKAYIENKDYTVIDSVAHSLEDHDSDDMSLEEYNRLVEDVDKKIMENNLKRF